MVLGLQSKPSILVSSLNRIAANLALEQVLIKRKPFKSPVLYLWRNQDCVILGRNQNAHSEVNLAKVKSAGVEVTRRYTGGGCVYQDLGNTVFTFILPHSKEERKVGNEIVLDALKRLGLTAYQSGRNDLLINGQKFSGSAFQSTPHRFVHHGTIIREMDLEKMAAYLTPHPLKKKEITGVPSVKSKVTQLKEHASRPISHEELMDSLIESFKIKFNTTKVKPIELDQLQTPEFFEHPVFIDSLSTLQDSQWVYGPNSLDSPSFWFKNTHGVFEIQLNLEDGFINDVSVFTDSLDLDIPRRVKLVLTAKLIGRRFHPSILESWVQQWDPAAIIA